MSRAASSVARIGAVVAALCLVATAGVCSSVTVTAPEGVGGEVTIMRHTPAGTRAIGAPESVRPRGDVTLSIPDLPDSDWLGVVVLFQATDGRIWRGYYPPGGATPAPSSIAIAQGDLRRPGALLVRLSQPAWSQAHSVAIVIVEADGYVRTAGKTVTPGRDVEIGDLMPGDVVVHAIADNDLSGRCRATVTEGGLGEAEVPLLRPRGTGPELGPLFTTGGDVGSGLYAAISVVTYILVILVWATVAALFPMIWAFFGLRDRMASTVLLGTAVVVGLVLLGNGIGLLLFDQVRYVPLVAAVAGAQLVFLVMCLVAYASRQAWARSLSVLMLIFSLLASLAFLPAFAFEGENADVGRWLTGSELVLVCAASFALTLTVLADRRRAARVRQSRQEICPKCGKPQDPMTGRCHCPPGSAGSPGRRAGRLAITYADGRRDDVLIGQRTTFGTDPGCDIHLGDDPAAAPVHATIVHEAGELVLRDQGSRIGTFVNGRKITERALRDGDEITLGGAWLVVELL
jgi:hypothetical protein